MFVEDLSWRHQANFGEGSEKNISPLRHKNMQYRDFSAVKIEYFIGNFDIFIFSLKILIVGTRYNRPHSAVLMSTHNICFGAKIRKIVCPCRPNFYYIKVGYKVV